LERKKNTKTAGWARVSLEAEKLLSIETATA